MMETGLVPENTRERMHATVTSLFSTLAEGVPAKFFGFHTYVNSFDFHGFPVRGLVSYNCEQHSIGGNKVARASRR
jgi:hypothetical protein